MKPLETPIFDLNAKELGNKKQDPSFELNEADNVYIEHPFVIYNSSTSPSAFSGRMLKKFSDDPGHPKHKSFRFSITFLMFISNNVFILPQ